MNRVFNSIETKIAFLALLLIFSLSLNGQSQNRLEELVEKNEPAKVVLQVEQSRIQSDRFKNVVEDYVLFNYDESTSKQVMNDKPKTLNLVVPTTKGDLNLNLVKVNVTSPDYSVESSSGNVVIDNQIGEHYRGIVEGEKGSIAAVSFFNGTVSIMASTKVNGNFTINKMKDENLYISYYDNDLKVSGGFECHTAEPEGIHEYLQTLRSQKTEVARGNDKCVRVHIEIDNDLFNNKGSVAAAASYIEAAWNQVAVIYAGEGINTVISYIHVWDTEDPFGESSSSDAINDFQRYILQGAVLNGDLGHLVALDPGGNGGVARGIGVLCLPDDNRLAYSDIFGFFNDVPTYSWDIMVMTHEMGHNLGSPHTHGCYWNGNNTQIDDCGSIAGQAEGQGCYDAANPIVPLNGGYVMSYCHLNAVGINLALGFGDQSGDLIRLYYNGASCLTACPVSECVEPYQLAVDNVSLTGGEISWYHETENSFEVIYSSRSTSDTLRVAEQSEILSGLQEATRYDISVKTLCADDTESEAVGLKFSTACDQVFTLPYVELFEGEDWIDNSFSADPCWDIEASDEGYIWGVNSFETSSANTGPDGDHSSGSGKYLYSEASFGEFREETILISPTIDLGTSVDPFITFWYHMFGSEIGQLSVEISRNNGNDWFLVDRIIGQQQTSISDKWRQSQISLSAFEGEKIKVRFVGSRGTDFAGDISIDDFIITDSSLVDIALGLDEPVSDCGLSSSENIKITFENTGYQSIAAGTAIDLKLKLNGSIISTEPYTLSNKLEPGSSVTHTLNTLLNLSTPNEYNISITANFAADEIEGNNTGSKKVVSKKVIYFYPYMQSFENGSDWTTGGIRSSWELGTPAKSVIVGASDGTKAWVTGGLGSGFYNADEDSYLESPCFDFSNLTNPKIEMDIWWEIETIWEGATFQYSTDNGLNWNILGSANDADWFNADTITTLPGIDGWTGTDDGDNAFTGSGGWITVKHDLTGLEETQKVLLRFLFKTDPAVAFDGIAVDNIKVTGDYIIPICSQETVTSATCNPSLAGTVLQTFKDVSGCDSAVVTVTELLPSYDIVFEEITCDPNLASIVIDSFKTYLGCDSIITSSLVLAPSYNDTIFLSSCNPNEVNTTTFNGKSIYNCDSVITTIIAFEPIIADFSYTLTGPSVNFSNISTIATDYDWDFGDGIMSTLSNPVHTYTTSGTYTVQMIASEQGCDSDTATQTISDVISSLNSIAFIDEVNVYPNPNNGNFFVEIKGQNNYELLTFELIDIRGKILDNRLIPFTSYARAIYNLENLANGVYFLRIQSESEYATIKINVLK